MPTLDEIRRRQAETLAAIRRHRFVPPPGTPDSVELLREDRRDDEAGARPSAPPTLDFYPLTPDRWRDLETLFGKNGTCGGCWCMWFKLTRSQFEKQKGAGNKRAMKKIVASGQTPGLLAYADGQAVGWCAVAAREDYPALERSRILKPVDDQPVWSVTCFFVAKPFRRKGVTTALLKAAVEHAKRQGAKIVEGYAAAEARAGLDRLGELALNSTPTSDLMRAALDVAVANDITAYDACYVALARQLGFPLMTADQKLARALSGPDDEVQWLGDFAIPPPSEEQNSHGF